MSNGKENWKIKQDSGVADKDISVLFAIDTHCEIKRKLIISVKDLANCSELSRQINESNNCECDCVRSCNVPWEGS